MRLSWALLERVSWLLKKRYAAHAALHSVIFPRDAHAWTSIPILMTLKFRRRKAGSEHWRASRRGRGSTLRAISPFDRLRMPRWS